MTHSPQVGLCMKSVDHLLILTPGFPKDETDFLCIPPLQAFLEALQEMQPSLKVTVVSLHYPFEAGEYLWKNIPIHALGGKNIRDPRRYLLWQRARKLIAKIHSKNPISVLHSFWLQECTWLGQSLAHKFGFAQVATLQGQDAFSQNRYLRKLDFSSLQVVAISDNGRKRLCETATFARITVIPWGLRSKEMTWQSNSERDIDILGVGSLVPVKRYDKFIRVLSALVHQNPNLRAVLVGDGPQQSQLRKMVADLNLEGNLEFAGLLPRPEVLELMGRSKIFLHPAEYEGQGYVFLEALARGMHLVSGRVGMAESMEKWALSDHTIGLVEASSHFLSNPVDELPRNHLQIEDTVRAYLEVYAS